MRPALDLRGIEPPEPLFRILDALDSGDEGPHVFLLPREPMPLYALLRGSGWRYRSRRLEDACEVTVYREARNP